MVKISVASEPGALRTITAGDIMIASISCRAERIFEMKREEEKIVIIRMSMVNTFRMRRPTMERVSNHRLMNPVRRKYDSKEISVSI
jgi:hypothetical protein